MSWWRSGRRPSSDDRLDAELRDHIERHVADLIARGSSETDARRQVGLEFGGLDQAKEACRDVRPRRWLEDLVRDVRFGFRGLGRDRLFALSVTIILARHRHERDDVQRAQRGRAVPAALCASRGVAAGRQP